ncbi:MAG: type II toxin-antitoxin system RelE/ParE family toxin [Roseimicrobium sp.]
MMPIVFEDEARNEYREAIGYYHNIDPDLHLGFRAEVGHLLRFIASNPLVPRLRRHGVRRINLERFAHYYIAYMIWKEQIVIVAIGHAKKRPYYWRRRPKGYRDTH